MEIVLVHLLFIFLTTIRVVRISSFRVQYINKIARLPIFMQIYRDKPGNKTYAEIAFTSKFVVITRTILSSI